MEFCFFYFLCLFIIYFLSKNLILAKTNNTRLIYYLILYTIYFVVKCEFVLVISMFVIGFVLLLLFVCLFVFIYLFFFKIGSD